MTRLRSAEADRLEDLFWEARRTARECIIAATEGPEYRAKADREDAAATNEFLSALDAYTRRPPHRNR